MADGAGFDQFYQGSCRRLLGYVFLLTGDLPEAQDVVQEAYMQAWQHWSTIEAYDEPEAWMRMVANRIAISRWRRIRGRARAYLRHGAADPVPAPSLNTVAVVAALRRLPDEQRRAVAMHYLLGMPVVDIARETSAPVGTVKARLHRGRAALGELLAIDSGEHADA
ncbi:SigE family RNA polymerase sigma factor [Asanoa siamensis]|uniref:RNA polymerase sigma24 factor n=1 Tax=Asanoa siamensis TaxID=926357 RepID=A0ABQ4D3T8_9ACTN|nr:SigE family RNA polymerase sigma factor [Asanoa siamensis]GIF78208.1 RNA polymerase sigma24 factor [Asanoa siamensis]